MSPITARLHGVATFGACISGAAGTRYRLSAGDMTGFSATLYRYCSNLYLYRSNDTICGRRLPVHHYLCPRALATTYSTHNWRRVWRIQHSLLATTKRISRWYDDGCSWFARTFRPPLQLPRHVTATIPASTFTNRDMARMTTPIYLHTVVSASLRCGAPGRVFEHCPGEWCLR